METEDRIKQFLRDYGYGNGDGDGDGDGYGNGYDDGSGNGNGNGYGSGSGNGYGDDIGSGNGDGDGYGNDIGSGTGYGCGYGCGTGYGDGTSDGCGDGYGDGYGDDSALEVISNDVYSIDGISCRFDKIHSNWAKVTVISKDDFSESPAFIAKYENCFAHGDTIKEAMADAMEKYFSGFDFEQIKENLLAEFKAKERLTVAELYRWHGLLTGSCRFGRSQFQKEHDLKDDDTLSLDEFVQLCGNAYGGDKVRMLMR